MSADVVTSANASAGQLLSVTAHPGRRRGRVVVEVVGEVDTYTVPLLDACLQSQVSRPDVRELVVDLTAVTLLGAAGVAVLAQVDHRCRQRGARLVIRAGGRRGVLRPLQLTGLADRVAVDPAGGGQMPPRDGRTGRRPRTSPRRPSVRRPHRVCR